LLALETVAGQRIDQRMHDGASPIPVAWTSGFLATQRQAHGLCSDEPPVRAESRLRVPYVRRISNAETTANTPRATNMTPSIQVPSFSARGFRRLRCWRFWRLGGGLNGFIGHATRTLGTLVLNPGNQGQNDNADGDESKRPIRAHPIIRHWVLRPSRSLIVRAVAHGVQRIQGFPPISAASGGLQVICPLAIGRRSEGHYSGKAQEAVTALRPCRRRTSRARLTLDSTIF
jgi:hypothetical protein